MESTGSSLSYLILMTTMWISGGPAATDMLPPEAIPAGTLPTEGSVAATGPAQPTDRLSTARMHQDLAIMHARFAECLRSSRAPSECDQLLMENCPLEPTEKCQELGQLDAKANPQ